MANLRRVLVALYLPPKVPELIKVGRAIVEAMTGNASFPNPTPPLPVVTSHLDELDSADTAARARTKGLVQVRKEKRIVVVKDLRQLESYVQAEADAHPDHAEAMIASAAMDAVEPGGRQKQTFGAWQGDLSGDVDLMAVVAGRRASYFWQWSLDQSTWISAPSTMQARTTIHGLTPGKTYYFRYKALTKDGETDWSQVVSLLVK